MKTELRQYTLRQWVGLLLLLLTGPAYGVVSMTPVNDITLPNWNPAVGDVNGTVTFCVQSTRGNSNNVVDYRSRVFAATGVHEIVNSADATQRIPIRLYHEDFLPPANTEQFVGTNWLRNKKGVASCSPYTGNAGVRVEVDALDIGQVTAGSYEGSIRIDVRGNGGDSDIFIVRMQITESAWIQGLDPIALTYALGSDAIGNESFCIWSSTAAYDITISSQTPTASTSFIATGQAVPANTAVYDVRFDNDADASDGVAVTEGVTILNQSTTATGSPASCLTDNSAIRVNFIEVGNLDAIPTDTYFDELTLFVEPR